MATMSMNHPSAPPSTQAPSMSHPAQPQQQQQPSQPPHPSHPSHPPLYPKGADPNSAHFANVMQTASNNNPLLSPDHDIPTTQKRTTQLNTYIYDYFLKRGYYDCARALLNDPNFPKEVSSSPTSNGNNQRDSSNSESDSSHERPGDDLPRANLSDAHQNSSFLFDWFNLFMDIFLAQRNRSKSPDATHYVQFTDVRSLAFSLPFFLFAPLSKGLIYK